MDVKTVLLLWYPVIQLSSFDTLHDPHANFAQTPLDPSRGKVSLQPARIKFVASAWLVISWNTLLSKTPTLYRL